MDKKVVSLLIFSIIVFVNSNPVDRADDGGKQIDGKHFSYTVSPGGLIVSTPASGDGRKVDETHVNKSEVPPAASTDANSSSSLPSAPDNGTSDTSSGPPQPLPTTTPQPLTTTTNDSTTTTTNTSTTTPTPPPTTTTTVPTTTLTPPATTSMPTPETTKVPPTSTPSATTTAATATTTIPNPTASPSKDRRFDGPSFIGGIVLSLGIMAIGFVAFKFYKARTERNYHTL